MAKYVIVLLRFLITLQVYAANRTWTNANNTGLWSDAGNWSGGKPGSNDKAVQFALCWNVRSNCACPLVKNQIQESLFQ